MRITVDLDKKVLQDVLRVTGETKKSPAVARALREYLTRMKAREFGRLIREGAFHYPYTNEDIERADV
jgi:Arc/MetJ family transcription regulator